MFKSFKDNLNIKGHLTIHKVVNNQEELVYDEDNVIVSGFGWALSHLYASQGSDNITDFQIDRFKLGVSGQSSNQVNSTTDLSGALSSTTEYISTGDSNLAAISGYLWVSNDFDPANPSIYSKIPYNKVTRIDDKTVRYTIFVDEDSCNNLSRPGDTEIALSEIGLYIKNPKKNAIDTSVLAAYRYFSKIRKTSDFGLVFRWTISFA
jgi:hypothetical protein